MGNNEGIGLSFGMQGEELPIVPEVRNLLYDLRSFRILSDWIQPMRQRRSQPPPPLKGTKPEVLGRLTQTQWRAAGTPLMDERTPTDSVYQALLNRFERNLRDIVEAAQAQNTQVVIIPTAPHLGYPPSMTPTIRHCSIRHPKIHSASRHRQRSACTASVVKSRGHAAFSPRIDEHLPPPHSAR